MLGVPQTRRGPGQTSRHPPFLVDWQLIVVSSCESTTTRCSVFGRMELTWEPKAQDV